MYVVSGTFAAPKLIPWQQNGIYNLTENCVRKTLMYMDRYWHLLSPPETKTSFRKLHSCEQPQTDLQTVHVIDGTTKLGFDVPVGITWFYTYMTDSLPNHFSNVSRKVKVNGQPHQSAQLSLPRTISSLQLFTHNPCWNGYSHSHSHII